jgi:hypothetical protein
VESELTPKELRRVADWLPDCPLCDHGCMSNGEKCSECRGCDANPSALATIAALIAEREAAARQQGRAEGLREAANRLYAEADKSCLQHAAELASIASGLEQITGRGQ